MSALFAYGTLLIPEILRQVIGRRPARVEARLPGYACRRVRDQVYPAIVAAAGGEVPGALYVGLEPAELDALDDYEGDLYERQEVSVLVEGSPAPALTYVLAERFRHHLTSETWELEPFRRAHLASYLERLAEAPTAPRRRGD